MILFCTGTNYHRLQCLQVKQSSDWNMEEIKEIRNYDRQTDQPTKQPTNQRTAMKAFREVILPIIVKHTFKGQKSSISYNNIIIYII